MKTLNVTLGDTITASYTPGTGFLGSSGTTSEIVTALPITVTAAANTKIYDGTTSATALPTISSGTLVAGDTAAFTESYSTSTVGTGMTLTASGSVIDSNGGSNYAVTFVPNTAGVITSPGSTSTTTTVTTSASPAVYGTSVTFTATVSAASAPPRAASISTTPRPATTLASAPS